MAKNTGKNTDQESVSRRRQIIMAAARLFLKKGIHKTTMREIARESGIVVGTLYHYIKTKDDIMTLIMDEELAVVLDFIQESEKTLSRLGPVKALRLTIDRYLHMIAISQDLNVFWYQESGNLLPDQRQRLIECEYQLAEIYSKILMAGCRSGDFKEHDTVLMAHDIIVLGDMWAFRRWFVGKHCTLEEFIRHQTDLILSGISGKASPGAAVQGRKRRKSSNRGGDIVKRK
jgi:AcrR family transcriptional regulator